MKDERLRPWRQLASRRLIDSPFLRVRVDSVELPSGERIDDYYVRETTGFCIICAITPEDRIVLVRQFKYGIGEIVVELPAGMIDGDETPPACARRELREETGYTSSGFEHVRSFATDPTGSNGRFHVFLAHAARRTHETEFDSSEDILTELVTATDYREMLRDGRIVAGSQVAAGYAVLDRLGRLEPSR